MATTATRPPTAARVGWWAALVMVPLALAAVALAAPGVPGLTPVMSVPMPVPAPNEGEAAPTAAGPAPAAVPDADRARVAIGALVAAAAVTFPPDSAQLTGAPAGTVARVAAVLRDAPAAAVQLVGYCADSPGPPAVAQRLSEQRAVVVADALVAAGVDRARISTAGRGAADPLATPAASRRVEITVR